MYRTITSISLTELETHGLFMLFRRSSKTQALYRENKSFWANISWLLSTTIRGFNEIKTRNDVNIYALPAVAQYALIIITTHRVKSPEQYTKRLTSKVQQVKVKHQPEGVVAGGADPRPSRCSQGRDAASLSPSRGVVQRAEGRRREGRGVRLASRLTLRWWHAVWHSHTHAHTHKNKSLQQPHSPRWLHCTVSLANTYATPLNEKTRGRSSH